MRVEFSDFRDLFTGLPPGALSLDDVRTTESCIYEDRRITVFYAPFDYLNQAARVVLVGVTPGPTQMLASYEIVRDALQASRTHQDALQMVKARASFKGMRRDLARWLDDLNLAAVLGLRSCSELFEDTHRALLHTTSAVRYPVFVRSRDGSLRNYSGRNPQFETHPWLCEMVETVLAAELSALPATIVVPLGAASSAITQLCDLGVLNPARCLLGLPHPSPASAFRERYFQAAKSHLISQVQNLDPDAGWQRPRRPRSRQQATHSASMPEAGLPPVGPVPGQRSEPGQRIAIRLSQGNLNNNHISLRGHMGFFPADAIGPANARDGQGRLLILHFDGHPGPVQTDLAGDKKIFRCRGDVGRFFARHHLAEGDNVVIERLSLYEYHLIPAPLDQRPTQPHTAT